MEADAIRARIERKTAELRQRYPDLTHCDSALSQRREEDGLRYSLYLELRWPRNHIVVSGQAYLDAGLAIDAAFEEAGSRVEKST